MTSIMSLIQKVTAVVLTVFWCIGSAKSSAQPFSTLDSENVNLNLTVFSDVHTESNNFERRDNIIKCFSSLDGSTDPIDAVILPGDNTMNGQVIENMFLYGMLETQCPVDYYYPCPGNHDADNSDNRETFLSFLNSFVDTETDTPYYYKIINGYYVIFMSGTIVSASEQNFGEEELDWLENVLYRASFTCNPIFIVNHFPLSYVSEGAQRYRELLTTYPNTFTLVGHMHYYFRNLPIRGEYTTQELWIPSLTMTDADLPTGLGAQLEVYDDEVVLRYRNYLTQTWDHDVSFALAEVVSPLEVG